MAARRLLIIMVILLAISTLAAALVPPPSENTERSSSTSTSSTSTPAPEPGDLIRAEVPVPKGDQAPRRVEVGPGDQLELTVTSGEPGEVTVPDLGLIEFAGPGDPATFNILIEERGAFPVRFQGSGAVATIVAGGKRPTSSSSS